MCLTQHRLSRIAVTYIEVLQELKEQKELVKEGGAEPFPTG